MKQCAKCSNFQPRQSYWLETVKSDRLLAKNALERGAARITCTEVDEARDRGSVENARGRAS